MTEYEVNIPEEAHTILKFNQHNLPGFATVNSALKEFEPKIVFAWHLSVLVSCVDLVANRLPSPEEQKTLYELEDKLDAKIKENGNALFLARVTHDGNRELTWRVYDPEVANSVLKQIIENGDHTREFDYRMEEDPKWEKAAWYLNNISA